ncbi:MAG TPA: isoleucine--tRNA ligase [Microthrixaceae bacterium]|nr:isoleucine--tRNA ligase [Microthrixaceae bacterium]
MSGPVAPSPDTPYPEPPSRPDFAAIERGVLERWAREGTFEASVHQRPADNEYVFYDGPPFANGLPHYGHLLTGYVKDVVPRYQTMRGHRVERRFGWDCHGLPVEMSTEKEIGVSGRAQITEYGIDRFNAACHTSVLRYTAEWERYVTRQARWVDFANDYKTLDASYMESVMWAFKRLWDQGLVYEAYRVMPFSWGAETPLSNFEIRLDDAMRPRQDPALTVRFRLDPAADDPGDLEAWAWTTTPWTLPANLALCAGPQLRYVIVESPHNEAQGGTRYVVLGASAVGRYAADLGDEHRVVAEFSGADLADRTYRPLFDYFSGHESAFRVLVDDYVSDDDGTGFVHVAPGHGEDDQRVGESNGIALVSPVDDLGRYTAEVTDWAGTNVFDANPLVARRLRDESRVVRHDTIDHNYPHCWRTDTPIIYKAVSSWYVEVTAIKDRLLAHNQEINWIPSHIRDGQFGKWLEGARDWSISRNRFWGAPIPVWRSDDPAYPRTDVYGSLDEIEADFGVRLADLHRPAIDDLVRPNPDDPTGASMMRRVPEVLDCWFESGSMPFAQVHYPFENKDWFDEHNPADFIVEYIPQTRGWFYTLHVLATALFDRPAFRNVICHGNVLDSQGRKLSKRLRNYPDPVEVMETIGADPLRWYLMSSPVLRGGELKIAEDGSGIADVVRLVINPIWNAYAFFCRYANVDGYTASERSGATGLLDRYAIAKTRSLVDLVTERLDAYDIAGACHEVVAFMDALNNWYIRRSRDRFWAPGSVEAGTLSDDKRDAYDTLYTVLTTLLRLTAPLLPMLSDELYRGLTGRDVHLADWPDAAALPADPNLVSAMDETRAVCSAALGLREEHGLRTRLPLATLTVAGERSAALAGLDGLIRDEVNVREVIVTDDSSALGEQVLRPNARVLGPLLGGEVQAVIKAAKAGEWTDNGDGTVEVAHHTLREGQFELALAPIEGQAAAAVRYVDAEGRVVDLGLVAALDTTVTPELEAEGLARDLIRLGQQTRKDLDPAITDRIALDLALPAPIDAAVRRHEGAVRDAVLATSVTYLDAGGDDFVSFTVGALPVALRVRRS